MDKKEIASRFGSSQSEGDFINERVISYFIFKAIEKEKVSPGCSTEPVLFW